MAFTLTPTRFRAEVERRLMDTESVRERINRSSRQTVFDWVEQGFLPQPILYRYRGYALWDADEVEEFLGRLEGRSV